MWSSTLRFVVVASVGVSCVSLSCSTPPSAWSPRPVVDGGVRGEADLKMDWRAGQEFSWSVEERYSGNAAAGRRETSRLVRADATWRIAAVEAGRGVLVEQRIVRVRYDEDGAQGRRRYDSRATEDNLADLPLVLERSLGLTGLVVRFRLQASGAVDSFEFPEAFHRNDHVSRLAAVPRLFTTEGWRRSVEVIALLPDESVRVGEHWQRRARGEYAFGSLETTADLIYRGLVEGDSDEPRSLAHRIDFNKSLELLEESEEPGPIFFEGGEANGMIYVSRGGSPSFEFHQRGSLALRYESRGRAITQERKSSIKIRLAP